VTWVPPVFVWSLAWKVERFNSYKGCRNCDRISSSACLTTANLDDNGRFRRRVGSTGPVAVTIARRHSCSNCRPFSPSTTAGSENPAAMRRCKRRAREATDVGGGEIAFQPDRPQECRFRASYVVPTSHCVGRVGWTNCRAVLLVETNGVRRHLCSCVSISRSARSSFRMP